MFLNDHHHHDNAPKVDLEDFLGFVIECVVEKAANWHYQAGRTKARKGNGIEERFAE